MRKPILILMVLIFLAFLGFSARSLLLPPPLDLLAPPDNLVTAEKSIELAGQTAPGVQITINGAPILPSDQGYFQKTIVLNKGLNILQIKASKRYAPVRLIERKILVTDSLSWK